VKFRSKITDWNRGKTSWDNDFIPYIRKSDDFKWPKFSSLGT
jgi:hypothetical protein